MKPQFLVVLLLATVIGVAVYSKTPVGSNVLGTSVVGTEKNEICWNGVKNADAYQVFFGQASTGTKDSAISEGLDNRSRCVKLSYLKPCTTYIWNLLRLDGGKWTWQWASDQRFATGGTCESAAVVPSTPIAGNGTATVTWDVADGAVKYYIYYKGAGDANWMYSVEVPAKATNYTINYLDPSRAYMYRVAALVNGKLIWQAEKNLVVE